MARFFLAYATTSPGQVASHSKDPWCHPNTRCLMVIKAGHSQSHWRSCSFRRQFGQIGSCEGSSRWRYCLREGWRPDRRRARRTSSFSAVYLLCITENCTATITAFTWALCGLSFWLLIRMEVSKFDQYHGYLSSVYLRLKKIYPNTSCLCVCVRVCVCVCVCVCISFHLKGFSWLKQNKCNARDQANGIALRKSLCVKYLRYHVIDNYNSDLKASNCVRVSFKPGRATKSKRELIELSENQR